MKGLINPVEKLRHSMQAKQVKFRTVELYNFKRNRKLCQNFNIMIVLEAIRISVIKTLKIIIIITMVVILRRKRRKRRRRRRKRRKSKHHSFVELKQNGIKYFSTV